MKQKNNTNTGNSQQLHSIYYVLSIWLNILYSIPNLILKKAYKLEIAILFPRWYWENWDLGG